MMWGKVICICIIFDNVFIKCTNIQHLNVGGLFESEDEELAFLLSVEMQNNENNNNGLYLMPKSVQIDRYNPLKTFLDVCTFLRTGVIGIFGPSSLRSSTYIQAVCDRKEIPHVETHWNPHLERSHCLVNLHPHPSVLATAYLDIVLAWQWRKMVVVVEGDEGLVRMGGLLSLNARAGWRVSLAQLESGAIGYRAMLAGLKSSGETNFVLDCSIDILEEVLKQAQQVGLMTDHYQFIITNLDMHTIDLTPFQFAGTNITGISMLNPETEVMAAVAARLEALKEQRGHPREPFESAAWKMRLKTALTIDAVHLFYKSISELMSSKNLVFDTKPLYCNTTDNWEHGYTIINYIKGKTVNGISGTVKFDTEGFRKSFSLNVLRLTIGGLIQVGTWNTTEGLEISYIPPKPVEVRSDENSLANKSFIIITSLTMPYTMLKETTTQLTGNERFEGYAVDLIEELSRMLGFNYTLSIQEDGNNGNKDPVTGNWTGMIGSVVSGHADMAIGDLTITADRDDAVDFTMQFMNLGISILYRKPEPVPPSLFMFTSPFSVEVWAMLGAAYFVVSLALFVMARVSPSEWTNPHPCIDEPEFLVNQFTIRDCFWFTTGSLMQQGSELAPVSTSTRTMAGIWYFFTLIMVSSYTANLAAFLTVETVVQRFANIEGLVNQRAIKYGCKNKGATADFFMHSNDSVKMRAWQFMSAHPEYMMDSNDEGVAKAEADDYAYFMESTTIEYVKERHCNLDRVGDLLDEKGYAIALKKNSPYRNDLSTAILRLQENGHLAALQVKWWKEKRGAGKCDINSQSEATPLDLKNIGGVFLVLVIGTILAGFGSFLEFVYEIYRKCKQFKLPFKEELKKELKFFIQLKQNVKAASCGDFDENKLL